MSLDNLRDYNSEVNPTQDRDYLSQAKGLVTQQFKQADIFNRYVELLVNNKTEILASIDQLMQDRSLDTSVGAQLDVIGRIVGQEREIVGFGITEYFGFDRALGSQSFGTLSDETVGGEWRSLNNPEFENKDLNDDEYRLIIKMKIIKNSSNGNIDSFLQAASILYNTDSLAYEELGGSIRVSIGREYNSDGALVPELDETQLGAVYLPIPLGVKLSLQPYVTLSLDFANNKYGVHDGESSTIDFNSFDSILNFSRNSKATYFDRNGLVKVADVDEPRLTYDPISNEREGLLIEEERTNLLEYPRAAPWGFNNVYNDLIIPNVGISPDGTLTASKVTEGVNSSSRFELAIVSNTFTTGTTLTFSYFFQRIDGENPLSEPLRISSLINFNTIETGVIPGNNYSRYYAVIEVIDGSLLSRLRLYYDLLSGQESLIWQAQLEEGSFPTSIIPDETSFISRASEATYLDENGDFQIAAVDEARDDAYGYDENGALKPIGLLLEEERTNIVSYPTRYNIAWTLDGVIATPQAGLAPDSSLNSTLITTLDESICRPRKNETFSTGSTYTLTGYVKYENHRWIRVLCTGLVNNAESYFDLENGVSGSTSATFSSIESVGNGFYRYTVIADSDANGGVLFPIQFVNGEGSTSYTLGEGQKVSLWHAQLEEGSFPTSVIPDATTFTSRSTTATFLDATGTIQTAAIDVARDDAYGYDQNGILRPIGLLLEDASTNELTFSEDFTNADWLKDSAGAALAPTVTADFGTAPDGTETADRIQFDLNGGATGSDQSRLFQNIVPTGTTTISVWLKSTDGSSEYTIALSNGNGITTDTVTGDWKRFEFTDDGVSSNFQVKLTGGQTAQTADLLVWGAQGEESTYATSYIPTAGSTVTRAADISSSPQVTRSADISSSPQVTREADDCVRTLGAEFNTNEFTLCAEAETGANSGAAVILALGITSSSTQSRVSIDQLTNDIVRLVIYDAAGNVLNIESFDPSTRKLRVAVSIKSGVYAFSVNGQTVSGVVNYNGSPEVLIIGGRPPLSSGDEKLNGFCESVRIFPRALSASELETLTS